MAAAAYDGENVGVPGSEKSVRESFTHQQQPPTYVPPGRVQRVGGSGPVVLAKTCVGPLVVRSVESYFVPYARVPTVLGVADSGVLPSTDDNSREWASNNTTTIRRGRGWSRRSDRVRANSKRPTGVPALA